MKTILDFKQKADRITIGVCPCQKRTVFDCNEQSYYINFPASMFIYWGNSGYADTDPSLWWFFLKDDADITCTTRLYYPACSRQRMAGRCYAAAEAGTYWEFWPNTSGGTVCMGGNVGDNLTDNVTLFWNSSFDPSPVLSYWEKSLNLLPNTVFSTPDAENRMPSTDLIKFLRLPSANEKSIVAKILSGEELDKIERLQIDGKCLLNVSENLF